MTAHADTTANGIDVASRARMVWQSATSTDRGWRCATREDRRWR